MLDLAVQKEIEWTNHITGAGVLGIPPTAPDLYTKYLADKRLGEIGLPALYNQNTNPYAHLERIANTSNEGHVKPNFFEGTASEYNMSSAVDGWDDI